MKRMPSAFAWVLVALLAACSSMDPATQDTPPASEAINAASSEPPTAVQGALVDPTCSGEPVAYNVRPFDLGDTSRPARVVVLSGSLCLGPTGQLTELWVQVRGEWVSQLKTAGTLSALPSNHQGYVDLTVQDLGPCAPVWHWEGSGYRAARTCP